MKTEGIGLLALNCFISTAIAGSVGEIGPSSPAMGGFFLGVGAAYEDLRVKSNASATLDAVSGFPPLGVFTGARTADSDSDDRIVPQFQAGYFRSFSENGWLWGLEFVYQPSRLKTTGKAASVHFVNALENVSNELLVDGFQTKMDQQFLLPVLIGHSFRNSFLYAGIGPSWQKAEHTVYGSSDTLSGYYIGNLKGFSREKWLWGGAVQAGMAYYLNPAWFLMANYTYSRTEKFRVNHSLAFTPEINQGLNGGFVAFNSSLRLSTQSVSLSINRVFG
ncbi:hypothetical protein Lbir_1175 [Legionella birminghamensis]|uniref:Opacity protein and related surface antigens n=1 Tax=Legionella birminghamensis TaxID=28083 RepID=A0A378I6Q4_9GAMM|nr:outer membrane beta-barrel protein [Legionella birminghamensis]KTC72400.1 hypothetical protein Lbir_1175 [Legionella birminghamensis]STX30532.1 Opacity protein and related surface antigens [Legionella birminghamensis]